MNFYKHWKPVALMVAVSLGFAVGNILIKKILEGGLNRLVILTYRQAAATIVLAPFAYFWERKRRPKLTLSILCHLFFGALMGLSLAVYFLLLGFEYTSAAFSCAFVNIVPVTTFLMALPLGQDKLNLKSLAGRTKVLGTIVCISGVLLLTLYKGKPLTGQYLGATSHGTNHGGVTNSSNKKAENWAIGSIFLVGHCFLWSAWFLIQERIGQSYPCRFSSTTIMSFFGVIQSAVLSLIVERNPGGWVMTRKLEFIAIVYAGAVVSGLCYAAMAWCVQQRGPVFTSAFTPLIQIFVVILGFFFLHERIYLGSVIGSIVVIIGLYVMLLGKSKEIEEFDTMKQPQVAEAQQVEYSDASSVTCHSKDPNEP